MGGGGGLITQEGLKEDLWYVAVSRPCRLSELHPDRQGLTVESVLVYTEVKTRVKASSLWIS